MCVYVISALYGKYITFASLLCLVINDVWVYRYIAVVIIQIWVQFLLVSANPRWALPCLRLCVLSIIVSDCALCFRLILRGVTVIRGRFLAIPFELQ